MSKSSDVSTPVHSWLALVIYMVVMVAAYVWSTFHPTAPLGEFSWPVTAGLGAYLGKRLYQRKFTDQYGPYGSGVDGYAGNSDELSEGDNQ